MRFKTNNAGGILGGITTGEEIRIKVAVKPTPTISIAQNTVDMEKEIDVILQPFTRRDATLLPPEHTLFVKRWFVAVSWMPFIWQKAMRLFLD